MPIAHPTSATPTGNLGEPAIAVSFALAKPGETVEDFRGRIDDKGSWGQTRYGREKVELIFTTESMEQLVRLLRRP